MNACGFQSQCPLNMELIRTKKIYERILNSYHNLFESVSDKASDVDKYQVKLCELYELDILMHPKQIEFPKLISQLIDMTHRLFYVFVDNKLSEKSNKDAINKDDIRLCIRLMTVICNECGLSISDIMKEDIEAMTNKTFSQD